MAVAGVGGWPSANAQRLVSMTTPMGLSAYRKEYFSGSRLLGYTTGERNIQIVTKNGNRCPTSRKGTYSALNHRDKPSTVAIATSSIGKKNKIPMDGTTPYQNMSTTRRHREIRKSTNAAAMALIGSRKRGK